MTQQRAHPSNINDCCRTCGIYCGSPLFVLFGICACLSALYFGLTRIIRAVDLGRQRRADINLLGKCEVIHRSENPSVSKGSYGQFWFTWKVIGNFNGTFPCSKGTTFKSQHDNMYQLGDVGNCWADADCTHILNACQENAEICDPSGLWVIGIFFSLCGCTFGTLCIGTAKDVYRDIQEEIRKKKSGKADQDSQGFPIDSSDLEKQPFQEGHGETIK